MLVSFYRLSCTVAGCLLIGGCTTLSTLGLPVTGPHQLMRTTDGIRQDAGQPVDLPRELTKAVMDEYVIEPGDVLIVEAADFNSPVRFSGGDQPVQPDGSIDLGKYGRLPAAGQTLNSLQSLVQAAVENQEDEPGQILVRLLAWDSKVFYVMGEVNAPGAYPYQGRETVLDAIVAAGDLTDHANRHKIIFSRPSAPEDCRFVLPICYNQIVQLGDTSTNYQILPGDRIFVASMTIWDDLAQTLFPRYYEKCPRCGSAAQACFAADCDGDCATCAAR